METYHKKFDLIFLFCCILQRLVNEYWHTDASKAKQFFDDIWRLISVWSNDTDEDLQLEDLSIDDVISANSKYSVKNIDLEKEDHEIFVNIIRHSESVYLPVYLKQNVSIRVLSNKNNDIDHNKVEKISIRQLHDSIENFEKSLTEPHNTDYSTDLSIEFSSLAVTDHASAVITTGLISTNRWDRLALGCESGTLQVLPLSDSTSSTAITLIGHEMSITGIDFTCQSDQIVSSSLDGTVRVWCEASGECAAVYSGHLFPVWDIATNPQIDACFVSASMDGTVCVWDAYKSNPVRQLTGHLGAVRSVQFLPQSDSCLATGGDDGQLRLWDTRSGGCARLWEPSDGSRAIETVAFSRAGRDAIFGTDGGSVEWAALEGGPCGSVCVAEDSPISAVIACGGGSMRESAVVATVCGAVFVLERPVSVNHGAHHCALQSSSSRIINLQNQSEHGSRVLVIRDAEQE